MGNQTSPVQEGFRQICELYKQDKSKAAVALAHLAQQHPEVADIITRGKDSFGNPVPGEIMKIIKLPLTQRIRNFLVTRLGKNEPCVVWDYVELSAQALEAALLDKNNDKAHELLVQSYDLLSKMPLTQRDLPYLRTSRRSPFATCRLIAVNVPEVPYIIKAYDLKNQHDCNQAADLETNVRLLSAAKLTTFDDQPIGLPVILGNVHKQNSNAQFILMKFDTGTLLSSELTNTILSLETKEMLFIKALNSLYPVGRKLLEARRANNEQVANYWNEIRNTSRGQLLPIAREAAHFFEVFESYHGRNDEVEAKILHICSDYGSRVQNLPERFTIIATDHDPSNIYLHTKPGGINIGRIDLENRAQYLFTEDFVRLCCNPFTVSLFPFSAPNDKSLKKMGKYHDYLLNVIAIETEKDAIRRQTLVKLLPEWQSEKIEYFNYRKKLAQHYQQIGVNIDDLWHYCLATVIKNVLKWTKYRVDEILKLNSIKDALLAQYPEVEKYDAVEYGLLPGSLNTALDLPSSEAFATTKYIGLRYLLGDVRNQLNIHKRWMHEALRELSPEGENTDELINQVDSTYFNKVSELYS
ncbi:hypothetical protein HY486_00480 [Candidatus Woesearchaeota archaeon]|nr:hypothetical protein [Candidatus Woesearchaeota archaeon]